MIADPAILASRLHAAIDKMDPDTLALFEGDQVFRSFLAVTSVLEDLGRAGVEGQATFLAVSAWAHILREEIARALGRRRADMLDRYVHEVARIVREHVPMVILTGREGGA